MKRNLTILIVVLLVATISFMYFTQHNAPEQHQVTASTDTAKIDTATTTPRCPTPETFVNDFNNFSIEFLDGHPEYGEKEQREGWDKHLLEMGCIDEQDILDTAICADCEEGEN